MTFRNVLGFLKFPLEYLPRDWYFYVQITMKTVSFFDTGKFKNIKASWNTLQTHCFLSLPHNFYFLNHVNMQCFDWTVQSKQTCWVFQKYLLLHKYLCVHGCFSCHVGSFMILFTSIFWCIYCFTGSSASSRVRKISHKGGYFSV